MTTPPTTPPDSTAGNTPGGTPGPTAAQPAAVRDRAVRSVVREVEAHVASAGWDAAPRLFALVRTANALGRDPELATQLPVEVVEAAREDREHLTAVEQEDLPDSEGLEDLLARIAWPTTVDGAVLVVERIVLPPQVEEDVMLRARAEGLGPDDVITLLAQRPERAEVRVAAAVLRDGSAMCALRQRDHDTDDQVAVAPDLVPSLVTALRSTFS